MIMLLVAELISGSFPANGNRLCKIRLIAALWGGNPLKDMKKRQAGEDLLPDAACCHKHIPSGSITLLPGP